MTQEQNSTVQTLEYGETKALEIKRALRLSSHDLPCLARYARKIFEEGAAEQRRKDAEDCSAVYQYQYSDQSWCDTSREAYDRHTALDPNDTRILYTHPANVAALEARIAELQAENDHQRTQILEMRNDDRRIRLAAERVCSVREGSEIFEARIALRAALTREGGV